MDVFACFQTRIIALGTQWKMPFFNLSDGLSSFAGKLKGAARRNRNAGSNPNGNGPLSSEEREKRRRSMQQDVFGEDIYEPRDPSVPPDNTDTISSTGSTSSLGSGEGDLESKFGEANPEIMEPFLRAVVEKLRGDPELKESSQKDGRDATRELKVRVIARANEVISETLNDDDFRDTKDEINEYLLLHKADFMGYITIQMVPEPHGGGSQSPRPNHKKPEFRGLDGTATVNGVRLGRPLRGRSGPGVAAE